MQDSTRIVRPPKSTFKREITAALVLKVFLLGAVWAFAVHGVQRNRHAAVADLFSTHSAASVKASSVVPSSS